MTFETKWKYLQRVMIDGDTSLVGVITAFQFRTSQVVAVVEVSWIHNGDAKSGWFEESRLSEA